MAVEVTFLAEQTQSSWVHRSEVCIELAVDTERSRCRPVVFDPHGFAIVEVVDLAHTNLRHPLSFRFCWARQVGRFDPPGLVPITSRAAKAAISPSDR